jgi:hypothetical protein
VKPVPTLLLEPNVVKRSKFNARAKYCEVVEGRYTLIAIPPC